MVPKRPETFEYVSGCGCLSEDIKLSKAAGTQFGSPGEYLGFGSYYPTAEQAQRGLDLTPSSNSAEWQRRYAAREPPCGCWGPIAKSDSGDWQFEVSNSEVLEQVEERRVPHELEVRAARAAFWCAIGALGGGFFGLALGRPGAGAALGAAIVGGAAAAAPMPPPVLASEVGVNHTDAALSEPALPLLYHSRPSVLIGLRPSPLIER